MPGLIVIENREVSLSLPSIARALGFVGSGKAAAILSGLPRFCQSEIAYWGECDEVGFGMLASLRSQLSQVRRVPMDDSAFERWSRFAVPGKRDRTAHPDYLTQSERRALELVMEGPWLLEQERMPAVDAIRRYSTLYASSADVDIRYAAVRLRDRDTEMRIRAPVCPSMLTRVSIVNRSIRPRIR